MTNKTAEELMRSAWEHLHEADIHAQDVIPLLQALNEQVQHMQIAAVDMQKAIDALRNEANINGTLSASDGVDEEVRLYPAGEPNYGHIALIKFQGNLYRVDVSGTELRVTREVNVPVYWEGAGNYVYMGEAFVRYQRLLEQRINLRDIRDLKIGILNETHLESLVAPNSDKD